MINNIHPHRFSNQYRTDVHVKENDYILHYRENNLLWKVYGDEFELPRLLDFSEISERNTCTFLFSLNDVPCFLFEGDMKVDDLHFIYKEISFFRNLARKELAWISLAGFHLMNWYKQNRYCGKCGSLNSHKTDERAMECSSCNTIVYPKISPAIIVAIICKDKILLARNTNFPGAWYSLLAGYADVGETLEETHIRVVSHYNGRP